MRYKYVKACMPISFGLLLVRDSIYATLDRPNISILHPLVDRILNRYHKWITRQKSSESGTLCNWGM